jgi:hypothetical protein
VIGWEKNMMPQRTRSTRLANTRSTVGTWHQPHAHAQENKGRKEKRTREREEEEGIDGAGQEMEFVATETYPEERTKGPAIHERLEHQHADRATARLHVSLTQGYGTCTMLLHVE